MATVTTSYVKFVRGSKATYQGLASHDPDTLYFVYENKQATSGLLYLGDKLISGGISGVTKLSNLEDVLLSIGIGQNDILTYDTSLNKWVNTPLSEILEIIVSVFTGATATADGTSGLVPKPLAGEQDKFLKGDGSWAYPPGAQDISELRAVVATIVGEDTGKSMRTVSSEEMAKIVDGAPESFNTLKKIAIWIETHKEDVEDLKATVNALAGRVTIAESAIITISNDLTIMKPKVENLELGFVNLAARVTANEGNISTLQETTTSLEERLRWWNIDTQI